MLAEVLCGVAGALTGGAALATTGALRLHDERAIHGAAATAATIRLETAQRERDTAMDALHRLVQALESTGEYEVEHALDAARWVLQGGDYTGRLTAALTALDEVVQELADLRALAEAHGLDLDHYTEHADRALAVVRAEADRVEPAGALHRIRQLISRSTTC